MVYSTQIIKCLHMNENCYLTTVNVQLSSHENCSNTENNYLKVTFERFLYLNFCTSRSQRIINKENGALS